MPNLQDIRRRIRSVRNLQQLTKAMKMVSAAKLKRAQDRVIAARPYANTMTRVLARLAERTGLWHHPLLEQRGDTHYILVLITADKGLCGGFNANLIKAAQDFISRNKDKRIELVTIGRKGRDFFRRRASIIREYTEVTARAVRHTDAAEIAQELMNIYMAEDSTVDRVFLIYSEFRSALSQQITLKQLLPIGAESFGAEGESAHSQPKVLIDYIYEQPPAEILGKLLPRYIQTQVYHALLESVASEHGARMAAMDSASKNAGEVIDSLTLNMNRVRQASITREIIEVVSGAEALK
jgi:F-type H+-transporting ATPase subunit gamma